MISVNQKNQHLAQG